MATNDKQYKAVDVGLLLGTEAVPSRSAMLWEKLARELTDIIGMNGFQALYLRSLQRTRQTYPLLPSADRADFDSLKAGLEQQTAPQALAASVAFFNLFIETLTLLIGGALTAAIVQAAWREEIMASAQKGIQ